MFTLQFGKNTTLAAQMTAAEVTSGTLASAVFTDFSSDYLVIDYDVPSKREVIKCNISGTAISSITRGQEGTSAVQHEIGAKIGYNFVPSHYLALADGSGVTGAWTDWTPAYKKNNGTTDLTMTTIQARYMQIGKTVFVNIYANAGGDPAGAAIYFTAPVAPKSHATAIQVIGSAYGLGTGLTERLVAILVPAATSTLIGASVIGTNWGTANNEFRAGFTYEAA